MRKVAIKNKETFTGIEKIKHNNTNVYISLNFFLFWSFLFFIIGHPFNVTAQETTANTFTTLIGNYADPSTIYDNETERYYLTGTGGAGIWMHASATLEGLRSTKSKQIYKPGQGGGPDIFLWAPEMQKIDGKWYVYFTGMQQADGQNFKHLRIHVLECQSQDPLVGPWTYKGRVANMEEIFAIDATVFELKGKKYLIWSGRTRNIMLSRQVTWIAPMSDPLTVSGERVRISKATKSWEGPLSCFAGLMEGQEILHNNGKVFLAYSTFGYDSDKYRIGMLYMDENDDPMNPKSWKKHHRPMFQQDPSKHVYSTGHHSFFLSPDGEENWFMYHARATTAKKRSLSELTPRYSRAQRLSFDETGFPVFGAPLLAGSTQVAPSGEKPNIVNDLLENGSYIIRHKNSGLHLTLKDCNPERAAQTQLQPKEASQCQSWRIQAIDSEKYFTISSEYSGMLLEAKSSENDKQRDIQLWPPENSSYIEWQLQPVEDGSNHFIIVNKETGFTLSANNKNETFVHAPKTENKSDIWELLPNNTYNSLY